MGQHGPGICYCFVNGVALCPALHAFPPNSVLHRATQLGRVAGCTTNQYTGNVSIEICKAVVETI